jgi:prepilin-type N-terminal cleavage/methylation domain-containing protein
VSKSSGFTLLELCLAIAIGVIILTVALPSLGLLFSEQRLRRSFERFDALAARAQALSMSQRKAYFLVWDKNGITLRGDDSSAKGGSDATSHFDFAANEGFDLELPAALITKPPKRWVFWPTGTCEPANIFYHGAAGHWIARYDPLTVRGKLSLE